MTLRNPKQFTRLAIDVDQWRRDIRTFAETTNQALGAIVAELATAHSKTSNPMPKSSCFAKTITSTLRNSAVNTASPQSTGGQDRLAQLKSQLAERIAKTDGSENIRLSDGADA